MLTDAQCQELWAYVHGQLTEDERQALEARMRREPDIEQELLRVRQLDGILRDHLADAVAGQAALEDRILEAIESDSMRKEEQPWWRRHGFTSLLAAAALLSVLVGAPFYFRGPVEWEPVQFKPLEYRGDTPATQRSQYTRADADACFQAFEDALIRAMAEAGSAQFVPRPVITFSVRELARARLTIEVEARAGRDGTPVLSRREVGSVEEFEACAALLATEVADGIAAQEAVRERNEQESEGTR